jgi:formylglycine-generating enzyme required for sulfatase activity
LSSFEVTLAVILMEDSDSRLKLKVFVSYSRRDAAEFADELVAGLELAGFEPLIDRHDVAAGEDWEARLGGLIAQSDTVVFVVTPEGVKSERCVWEVNRTLELSKRLLPVIYKPVAEASIPEKLRRLQFVRFDTGSGITRPLTQLADALQNNLDWIREHTRLGELAVRWVARGRPESLLLRGDDLDAAKAWTVRQKAAAPEITDAQRALLNASEEAEAARFSKERAQLADMRRALEDAARSQRRASRLVWGVCVLSTGIITVLLGWINQGYIKEQWRLYAVTAPYQRAQVQPYVLSAELERALKPPESFTECAKDCPEMVVLPAGTFLMGSPKSLGDPDEYPQHQVTFDHPFALAKFELTFAEWDACATFGDCDPHVDDSGWGRGQQPVINVTWDDARRYVAWLSRMTGKPYRLPSEAEWEYAARAGARTPFYWGEKLPAPVGSFSPNAFGLYDMHGNVREWVEDCYQKSYAGGPKDGTAWLAGECHYRVVRDGSWGYPNPPRSASRWRDTPTDRSLNTGFRVARTLSP